MSVSKDVVFPAGTSNGSMQCINVTIIEDSAMEGDKAFTVSMNTSSPLVAIGNAVTSINIIGTQGENIYMTR